MPLSQSRVCEAGRVSELIRQARSVMWQVLCANMRSPDGDIYSRREHAVTLIVLVPRVNLAAAAAAAAAALKSTAPIAAGCVWL